MRFNAVSVLLIWGVVRSFYAFLWKIVKINAKRNDTRKTAAKSTKRRMKNNKNQHEDDKKTDRQIIRFNLI